MTNEELNKACAWLKDQMHIGSPEKTGNIYATTFLSVTPDFLREFRKAMEAVIKESLTSALTWQDVQKIWRIGMNIADYNSYHNIPIEDEAFFKEILNKYINDTNETPH